MSTEQGFKSQLFEDQLSPLKTDTASLPASLRPRSLAELLRFASSNSSSSSSSSSSVSSMSISSSSSSPPFSSSSLRQVDGPLDTTSESEKSEDSFERRKKNRVDSRDVDPSFFETMEKIEEELGKESQDKTVYLGCLRNENAATALPYGHLVMIDSDDLNVIKKELPENYVYLKMMRKEVDGEKKIVPVCLKCNEKSITEALIKGTNKNIKGTVLEETLVKCKHAAVSKAVYYRKNVLNVENKSTNCTVLKNTKTLHMAACYDGTSFATIVCRIGRHSTKGKCVKCKGDRCGHNKAWNKELGSAVLKKRKRKEEESEYMSKSEDTEDNEILRF